MPLVGEIPPPPPPASSKRTPRSSTSAPKVKIETPSKTAERAKTLSEIASIGQGIALMTGNFADAETVDVFGPPFFNAVARLGDVHENFGESLDKAHEINPYLAVFAAGLPMVLQFMANHNRIDANRIRIGGIVPPDILDKRQRAKLANMQAEQIREQREAEQAQFEAHQRLQQEAAAMAGLREQINDAYSTPV